MTNSTMKTLDTVETKNDDAPVLLAMAYQKGFENLPTGLTSDTGIFIDDGGFSRIAMLLVLSFIAIVTISRRQNKS